MNLLLIKIFLTLLVAVATTFVGTRFKGSLYIFAIIVAVGTLFSVEITNMVALKLSDPKVNVTIEEEKKGEVLVRVNKEGKTVVDNIDIEIHTLGPVKNIHDLNDKTTFGNVKKCVIGSPDGYAQNTTEISLRDVSGNSLEFKILYESIPLKIELMGTDQYKYRYTWSFNGNVQEKRKVRSINTNKDVSPAPGSTKGFRIIPGVITPEEVSKNYESGLPMRCF